jgi:hypothetical protein
MHDSCILSWGTYHNVGKTRWACRLHATADMLDEVTGVAKGVLQDRKERILRSRLGFRRCMTAGCPNTCKYASFDYRTYVCETHRQAYMWFYNGQGQIAQYVPEPAVETKEKKTEELISPSHTSTLHARPSAPEAHPSTREAQMSPADAHPLLPEMHAKCARAIHSVKHADEPNEDYVLRTVMHSEPRITIQTTTDAIMVNRAGVAHHLPLSSAPLFRVAYPADVVEEIVRWMFKERGLHIERATYARAVQMLNFACTYSIFKLQQTLRDHLVGEYKDLTHAALLTKCIDPVAQRFLCRKLADAWLGVAKVRTCLNTPRQMCGDEPLYLCCACDVGRLSTNIKHKGAFTCSHYTVNPEAKLSTDTPAVVDWCCRHGRASGEKREGPSAQLLEILDMLPAPLRDAVDARMMV